AARAQPVSFSRPLVLPKSPGSAARHPDRATFHKTPDLYALCQRDISRTWRIRLRGSVRILFQQARPPVEARRSRAARGLAEGTAILLAYKPPRPRPQAAESRPQRHARRRQDYVRASRRGKEAADRAPRTKGSQFARAPLRRRDPPLSGSQVRQRSGPSGRFARLHFARHGPRKIGAAGPARRPCRLRAAPWLAWPAR